MTKRSAQKARTRNALKQAAQRLLRSKPIEQLTITQLAREAQVADGTFYVHFSSKNELLDELVADMNSSLNEQLMHALLAASSSAEQRLERLAAAYIDYWREHHASFELFRHHFAHNLDRSMVLMGTQRALYDLLIATFGRAAELEPAPVAVVVANLVGLWRTTGLALVDTPDASRQWGIGFLCSATRALIGELRPNMLELLERELSRLQGPAATAAASV